jgi:hypothetical protein
MLVVIAEDVNGDPPSQDYCAALAKSTKLSEVILVRDDATQIVSKTLGLNPVNHWHFVLGPGMQIAYAGKGKDSEALAAVQALIDAF